MLAPITVQPVIAVSPALSVIKEAPGLIEADSKLPFVTKFTELWAIAGVDHESKLDKVMSKKQVAVRIGSSSGYNSVLFRTPCHQRKQKVEPLNYAELAPKLTRTYPQPPFRELYSLSSV